jgi:IMP dehydrogenase
MPSVTDGYLASEMWGLGGIGVIHRFQDVASQIRELAVAGFDAYCAIGLDERRLDALRLAGCYRFCLDVAHAHSDPVLEFVATNASIRGETWMVGNVATAEGTLDLEEAGADTIKVGIGPGAACMTRTVTGFGVPQLSAIMECAEAAEAPIIADGGIRNSGDVVKALAAGAVAVMIGSLFASAKEAPNNGEFYGCASNVLNGHRAPEGVSITITQEKEPLEDIVKRLAWGLRSGISYAGARNLYELYTNAEWIKLTDGARAESFRERT